MSVPPDRYICRARLYEQTSSDAMHHDYNTCKHRHRPHGADGQVFCAVVFVVDARAAHHILYLILCLKRKDGVGLSCSLLPIRPKQDAELADFVSLLCLSVCLVSLQCSSLDCTTDDTLYFVGPRIVYAVCLDCTYSRYMASTSMINMP